MSSVTVKNRIPFWDNMKGILIFLVVYGHLLENMTSPAAVFLYKGIYLFHMPLFVVCSGYLAKFSPKRILKRILLPYIICQAVLCLTNPSKSMQFTTPVWTLWYLLALTVWMITIPFLEECPKKARFLVVLGAFALGSLCGMDDTVGYYLSVSRIVVFYPFFILGYYGKQWIKDHGWEQGLWQTGEIFHNKWIRTASFLALAAAIGLFLYAEPFIKATWLYGSYSYAKGGYGIGCRLISYLVACQIGLFLFVWVPKTNTFFGILGANSMAIYLLHGSVISSMKTVIPQYFRNWYGTLPGVILAFGICYGILWGVKRGMLLWRTGKEKWRKRELAFTKRDSRGYRRLSHRTVMAPK